MSAKRRLPSRSYPRPNPRPIGFLQALQALLLSFLSFFFGSPRSSYRSRQHLHAILCGQKLEPIEAMATLFETANVVVVSANRAGIQETPQDVYVGPRLIEPAQVIEIYNRIPNTSSFTIRAVVLVAGAIRTTTGSNSLGSTVWPLAFRDDNTGMHFVVEAGRFDVSLLNNVVTVTRTGTISDMGTASITYRIPLASNTQTTANVSVSFTASRNIPLEPSLLQIDAARGPWIATMAQFQAHDAVAIAATDLNGIPQRIGFDTLARDTHALNPSLPLSTIAATYGVLNVPGSTWNPTTGSVKLTDVIVTQMAPGAASQNIPLDLQTYIVTTNDPNQDNASVYPEARLNSALITAGTRWTETYKVIATPAAALPLLAAPKILSSAVVSDLSPTIQWTKIFDASSYSLTVRNSQTGAIVDQYSTLPGPEATIFPLRAGSYTLQVRANDANGTPGLLSAVKTLIIKSPVPQLTAPTGTITSQPTFTIAGEGVDFELLVRKVDAWSRHFGGLGAATFALPQLLGDGRYVVSVRSKNVYGQWSEYSPAQTFSINLPAPSKLTMQPLASSTNRLPTLQWSADPIATSFEVVVQNRSTGKEVLRKRTTDLSIAPTTPLGFASFRARVRGLSQTNEPGPWSDWILFSVQRA